jgi:uncharacterized protein YybS (DUF2232 family)
LKNDKTIVAYFVEYTVEKFEKFLITPNGLSIIEAEELPAGEINCLI